MSKRIGSTSEENEKLNKKIKLNQSSKKDCNIAKKGTTDTKKKTQLA